MGLENRIEKLEREQAAARRQGGKTPIQMLVAEMSDAQLERICGFPEGYAPTDEELQAIIDAGTK